MSDRAYDVEIEPEPEPADAAVVVEAAAQLAAEAESARADRARLSAWRRAAARELVDDGMRAAGW